MTIFAGIKAEDAIYDMESVEWKLTTRNQMKKNSHSWLYAWNHYNNFKQHYDDIRKFIGIVIDPEYCELARNRIKNGHVHENKPNEIEVAGVRDSRTIRSMIKNGDTDEDIMTHFKRLNITKKQMKFHRKNIEEEQVQMVLGGRP
jgi:hypothetical protein